MHNEFPLVSIVMATYNRAATIERAIDSVLNQTYPNIELIIVDDGSTDNTLEILGKYKKPSMRLYKLEKNKGVTGAKNSGLDQIKGEWFTILDSDDEIVPGAIEGMMKIPLTLDASVTAITCNCLDTTTNELSGTGLTKDQYIDVNTLMTVCKGEYWGMTKTSLLGDDRFNEKLRGFEGTLWCKIDDRAKRYYTHAAYRIYHTEGDDRIMKTKYNFKRQIGLYENLIHEVDFLNTLKKYQPDDFQYYCNTGIMVMRASNRKALATRYYELIKPVGTSKIITLSYKYRLVSLIMKNYTALKVFLKPYVNSLFKRKK